MFLSSLYLYGLFFLKNALISAPVVEKSKRVDFDERLIKAEGSKAGSVMIIERKKIRIPSLIQYHKNLRQEVISTVFVKE